jgi:hypothetical protein
MKSDTVFDPGQGTFQVLELSGFKVVFFGKRRFITVFKGAREILSS